VITIKIQLHGQEEELTISEARNLYKQLQELLDYWPGPNVPYTGPIYIQPISPLPWIYPGHPVWCSSETAKLTVDKPEGLKNYIC
jgi:hypothetical protein